MKLRTAAKALAWLALVALVVSAGPALRYARAATLLLGVVGMKDPSGLSALVTQPIEERDDAIALPGRTLRARAYVPRERVRGRAMLLHGVHPLGIDEPRLRAFARSLASIGVETITPQLDELAEQRVLPSTIDDIGACAVAIAQRHSGERIGAIGISFAGGLLLLAAKRDAVDGALAYAVTVGSHHDLRRVLRYYAGEAITGPDGERANGHAHPYGGRVMAAAYAELFFDAQDVQLARRALQLWLSGRYKDARALLPKLSEASRARFDVITQDAHRQELSALLLRAADQRGADLLAVSPASGLRGVRVPTFLVHGASDPIVPSLETRWLARELPKAALREALISPVLRHAEAGAAPPLGDSLALVSFVAGFLGASR